MAHGTLTECHAEEIGHQEIRVALTGSAKLRSRTEASGCVRGTFCVLTLPGQPRACSRTAVTPALAGFVLLRGDMQGRLEPERAIRSSAARGGVRCQTPAGNRGSHPLAVRPVGAVNETLHPGGPERTWKHVREGLWSAREGLGSRLAGARAADARHGFGGDTGREVDREAQGRARR